MKIIEQFIQSKTQNPGECEDGIFVSDVFVAVVDGATSKSPRLWEGKRSGLVAKDVLLERLKSVDAGADATAASVDLNEAIREWYVKENVLELMEQKPVERLTASAIIYSTAKREL